MHIKDIFARDGATYSFEFFPPKSEQAAAALYQAIQELEPLAPSFVSVTYGAGGSTRELTHDLVVRIKTTTQVEPVPHLTCVCHSREQLEQILTRYSEAGIGNILALAGDLPQDRLDWDRGRDACRHAADLVGFIRAFAQKHGHHDSRGFGIGVAGFPEGHPQTPNRMLEMDHLKAKVDAGADYICTQLFFDNRDFYDFCERCELAGIRVPIIAGIMPITSSTGMRRMADLAAGARFPAPLLRALQRCGEDQEAVARVGTHWATEQCRDLVDHEVAGIHFYTLNRSRATQDIFRTLGVTNTAGLRVDPGAGI